jgi:hypothetical protein
LVYRKAVASDDAELRACLRDNVMDSWVRMSLEREPNYFDAQSLMGESMSVIAHEADPPHTTVGMYNCGFFPVHINGAAADVGYLGGLRVNPAYRHKLRVVRNGFDSIKALVQNPQEVPYWMTSIASENRAARRLLQARLSGMPVYNSVGEMRTLAFATAQGRHKRLLQAAQAIDIPDLAAFFNCSAASYQFSARLTESWLKRLSDAAHADRVGLHLNDFYLLKDGDDITACIALWDQRRFKQTVARGYRFPLNQLRGAYNAYAKLARRLPLPAPGMPLQQVFLSFVAFQKSAEHLVVDVVREALAIAKDKGAQAGVLGLSRTNPLLPVLTRAIPAHVYPSSIQTVAWPGDPEPPLDGRAPQPEVALL